MEHLNPQMTSSQRQWLHGVNISSDPSWNMHVNEVVKKANVPKLDLLRFNNGCIWAVCNYNIPVFHALLPCMYFLEDLEQV